MQKHELVIPEAFRELFDPYRYKVYWGGRGSGKSFAFALALLVMGMNSKLRILCARELQISINDSVHKLLADLIINYNLTYFYTVQQATIRGKNGTEFLFKGLKHNATEIKSTEGINICWVEEAERVSDNSWELLIPTIRKDGSEIWLSFNAKRPDDATYKRFVMNKRDDSVVKKVSWRDNPFFPKVLDAERLNLLKVDKEAYDHIWEGEFDTRFFGGVYSKIVNKLYETDPPQINARVKHDPKFPVFTSWDLGFDDATAIWFWQVGGGEIMVLDYFEASGEGIKFYLEAVSGREIRSIESDSGTTWEYGDILPEHAHRKDWRYGAHYVPHDAMNKVMAAGGRSIVEQAYGYGVRMECIPSTSIMNSINALRMTLPRCWFNEDGCRKGIDALLNYAFEYDEDKGSFKSKPKHDWSSHAADALELMARVWREKVVDLVTQDKETSLKKFYAARRANNVDGNQDPYRVKPKRNKK